MTPDDLVVTPRGVRFRGRLLPCALGRGGITADKREGDGATPVGRHRLTGVLYRADRLSGRGLPHTARPIGPRDRWCDDPQHPAYNHPVRSPFAASAESLRLGDPRYDLILTTDWNWPAAIPGKGSAIFVHSWLRPGYPTSGCVAFARADLLWIVRNLRPGSTLIVRA